MGPDAAATGIDLRWRSPAEPSHATMRTIQAGEAGRWMLILARAILVILYTAILGTAGIFLCIVVPGGSALMPVARLWSRLVLRTYGVRFRPVYDEGLDPSRAYVYVANHQS